MWHFLFRPFLHKDEVITSEYSRLGFVQERVPDGLLMFQAQLDELYRMVYFFFKNSKLFFCVYTWRLMRHNNFG